MRLLNIIKSELNADKLKAEEELERVMNDKSLKTDDKIVVIKKILIDIATIKSSFESFKELTDDGENNNNEK